MTDKNRKIDEQQEEAKTTPLAPIGAGVLGALSNALQPFSLRPATFADDKIYKFASGLYLVTGGKGSGKSVVARAIAASVKTSGWEDVGVLSLFEPNVAPVTTTGGVARFVKDVDFINEGKADATGGDERFQGDLGFYLTAWQSGRNPKSPQAMLVIDSIASPLKVYLLDQRRFAPAGTKGLLPPDLAFCRRVNNTAVALNLTVLGVINDEMVEFAKVLDSVTQGLIRAENVAQFVVNDRPGARQDFSLTNTFDSVNVALAQLNYKPIDQASYLREVGGISQISSKFIAA
jgi:hypothetical protein